MRGPRYRSLGDFEILADNQGKIINCAETWNRRKQDGTAAEWTANLVLYVSQHPVASYSVQTLAIATMVAGRAQAGIEDTELELMAFII